MNCNVKSEESPALKEVQLKCCLLSECTIYCLSLEVTVNISSGNLLG